MLIKNDAHISCDSEHNTSHTQSPLICSDLQRKLSVCLHLSQCDGYSH